MKKIILQNKGLTLIEIIVSVSIIGILTAVGIASYTTFQETQTLKINAQNLINNLRTYQARAMAGEKASLCGSDDFYGYKIVFHSTSYEAYVTCSDTGDVSSSKKTHSLSSPVTLTSPSDGSHLIFKAMSGGIEASLEPLPINLCAYDKLYEITVSKTGEIQDEGITGSCI